MICKEEYKRQKVPQNFLNLQKKSQFPERNKIRAGSACAKRKKML